MAVNRLSIPTSRHHRIIAGGPALQVPIAKWVCSKSPHLELAYEFDAFGGSRPLFSAIGYLERHPKRILAGVVYEGYNGTNINLHVAALRGSYWATRSFLGEAFRYPFEQLGVSRVTGKTPASNVISRRMQEDLGFTEEGVIREGMPNGEDLVIYGMLKRECRWIRGKQRDDFERLIE